MSSNASRNEHYVAPVAEREVVVDQVRVGDRKSTLWLDAWRDLRKRPTFWVSVAAVAVVIVMAAWPTLFTPVNPLNGSLSRSNAGAIPGHPLGFDQQGYDIWARIAHGARTSLLVGLMATTISTVLGIIMGALAGFFGGWLDSLLSRIGDVFFTIPYILAGIVVMSVLREGRNEFVLALAIGGFAWASTARIVRAEVLRVKQSDYVMASIALGMSRFKTLVVHVLPNAMAPVIVVATITLGQSIVAESTLSFLGLGLDGASWGSDIQAAQNTIRTAPMPLIWPSLALAITVLAFISLGELLRDALDPKARAQR